MRDGKLDFFKGLLIWSVVLGHSLNILCPGTILHTVIRTFDLPMFMYISGYLMRGSIGRYDWKQLVLNKVTMIVFPAMVWIAVSFMLGDLHSYYFLWAVFVSSVVICLSEKVTEKMSMSPILGGVFPVLIVVIFHLIPHNVVNISFLYPFFVIGYFTENISMIGRMKGMVSLIVCICLILFVWKPEYSVWNTGGFILYNTEFMLQVVLLRLILGMAGIYSVVFIVGRLYDRVNPSSMTTLFADIGKQTLAIYTMQHIVVEIGLLNIVKFITSGKLILCSSIVMGYVVTPLVSLSLLYFMYRLALIMQASKYTKWMFGIRIRL